MQALILAAGTGSRLGKYTKENEKFVDLYKDIVWIGLLDLSDKSVKFIENIFQYPTQTTIPPHRQKRWYYDKTSLQGGTHKREWDNKESIFISNFNPNRKPQYNSRYFNKR